MNLKIQWHARQMLLAILTAPFSFTFGIAAMVAIRCYKFYTYGLGMYAGYSFPKVHTTQYEMYAFWALSLLPLLPWLAATLPADIAIRRFGFKLYE